VFPALQPWAWRTELLRELVTGERLVAARIEPVTRGREPTAFIDLTFSDGERSIAIPLVYVDIAQLDIREADALLFPQFVLGIVSDARACEIVDRVLPDLERRAASGGFWTEEALLYGDDTLFAAARARGFFGAAPLATSLPRIAAAMYAKRFAVGKHVVAYGANAVELGAFLAGVATSCTVLGDDAEASAWYGPLEPGNPGQSCDLAIGAGPPPVDAATTVRVDDDRAGFRVAVAAPIPADLMLAFHAGEGPAAAHFSVATTREPYARATPDVAVTATVGGSAGRVTIVVRPDGAAVPDSDTDEAAALAQSLAREGFTVGIVSSVDGLEASAPDLVHLFGTRPGAFARRVAEWAVNHRKPFAAHAFHEAPADGGYWGTIVAPYCFGYSGDDRSVSTYLDLLARRAVEVDGIGPAMRYAPAIVGLADTERVLGLADVVFVNSERELRAVEPFRRGRPTFIVAPLPLVPAAAEPVGAQVGSDPFVLVHAPIGPEGNQLIVARAAAAVGVPVVMAGPIEDPLYAERLREFAPDQLLLLDEPSPAVTMGLYRSAAVVADAAWIARGHGRLATAAAHGVAVVCSRSRWLELPGSEAWIVDPADVRSVSRGIGEAWDSAVRRDAAIEKAASFARERLGSAAATVVATYAKIAQGF
jgi:glycosyltransferase involved in cell wall biosynthesis